MPLQLLFLVFGVFACSTAVIMIKYSTEHAVLLSSYRQLVAALVLTPLFIRDLRRYRDRFGWRQIARTIPPGLLLGIHFITWIIAARMTTAGNASLIVNLVPVVMPFLLVAVVGERINKGEIAGTVAALAGLVLLTAADYRISRDYFWGDILCFGSMLFFAGYLVLARKNRRIFPTMWLYVVPLYYVGGIFCFGVALFQVNPIKPYTARNLLMILGLGIIPTVIGHSTLNYALKHLRGQIVGIVNMGQFLFAGIMAWILLDELPAPAFYPASALLVAGAVIAVRSTPGQR